MKRIVIFALGMLLATVGAHADALDIIKARGSLICGTLTNVPPLGFEDKTTRQVVGFDVDLCNVIAREMGVKVEYRGLSIDSRIPELQLGRVDIVAAALGYTKARAEQIDFTDAHYQIGMIIMTQADSGLTTLAQFNDKRVSAIKGSTLEGMLRLTVPKAEILTFPDAPSAFMAMMQDKVLGTATNEMSAARYKAESKVKLANTEPMAYEPTALGVKKGEAALLAEVNRVLQKLEAAGELDRIWDKWIGSGNAMGPDFAIPRRKKLTPLSQLQN